MIDIWNWGGSGINWSRGKNHIPGISMSVATSPGVQVHTALQVAVAKFAALKLRFYLIHCVEAFQIFTCLLCPCFAELLAHCYMYDSLRAVFSHNLRLPRLSNIKLSHPPKSSDQEESSHGYCSKYVPPPLPISPACLIALPSCSDLLPPVLSLPPSRSTYQPRRPTSFVLKPRPIPQFPYSIPNNSTRFQIYKL